MAAVTAPSKHVIGRIEDARPLDPAVKAVRTVVNKLLGPQAVRDVLHGVWFGHPLHPVLTDVPIGAWTSAAVLDLLPGTGPDGSDDGGTRQWDGFAPRGPGRDVIFLVPPP